MERNETISVELVYINPGKQYLVNLELPKGCTIDTAIKRSGLLDRFPELDLKQNKVGVFNKLKALDYVLNPGDRLEIYRPLLADPKEARRRRAEQN